MRQFELYLEIDNRKFSDRNGLTSRPVANFVDKVFVDVWLVNCSF